MAEEKILTPNPKVAFMILGILAIVFGAVNYLMSSMGWEPYMAWIAGGIILLLISWAKSGTGR